MTVLSPRRPGLAACREATATAFPKLVGEPIGVVERKLTAYIAGVKDVLGEEPARLRGGRIGHLA